MTRSWEADGIAWDGSPGSPGTGHRPASWPASTPGSVRLEAGKIKHDGFIRRIGEVALDVGQRYGAVLRIHYNPDSRRIRREAPFGRGFPDLVIAGPGGVVFAECKCADDTVSREQRAWGTALLGAGATWVVWEPIVLFTGQLETELAALCVRSRYLDRRADVGQLAEPVHPE
jgi:hypothetical protein